MGAEYLGGRVTLFFHLFLFRAMLIFDSDSYSLT